MEYSIGIVGNGFVGGATYLLKHKNVKAFIYDIEPEKCIPYEFELSRLTDCRFIFVCVPTPREFRGSCSTYEVEKVVFELLDNNYDPERIIIRSTVPVGTSRKLGTMSMPEFLREEKWESDFLNRDQWILGTNNINNSLRDEVCSLFNSAYKNGGLVNRPTIHFLSTEEAELVKYVRNCFLATKVSFFNEVSDFCKFNEIDYERLISMVTLDKRIGESHTEVPGPDGKTGFGGACFPKDMDAFQHQLKKCGELSGRLPSVVKACIERNNKIDRPEK